MVARQVIQLPAREHAAETLRLREAGATRNRIAVAVFGTENRCYQVQAILDDPHGYDPVDDPVAVARALQGDPAVWPSLTHYERRTVMLEVHRRRTAERLECEQDRADLDGVCSPWEYRAPVGPTPDWVRLIAAAAEMSPSGLLRRAKLHHEAEEML